MLNKWIKVRGEVSTWIDILFWQRFWKTQASRYQQKKAKVLRTIQMNEFSEILSDDLQLAGKVCQKNFYSYSWWVHLPTQEFYFHHEYIYNNHVIWYCTIIFTHLLWFILLFGISGACRSNESLIITNESKYRFLHLARFS